MRSRRQKRFAVGEDEALTDQKAKPAKIAKNSVPNKKSNEELNLKKVQEEEQTSSRPVRQRKVTKKLEESYSAVPSSLLTNKSETAKRPKCQSRPKQQHIKVEPNIQSEDEYNGLAEELLKSIQQSEQNNYSQYLRREEIFDSPEVKIKEEPLDYDDKEGQLTIKEEFDSEPENVEELSSPISTKFKIDKIKCGPKKLNPKKQTLKKSLLRAQRNRVELHEGSIFDDKRLRPPNNVFSKYLPKPEMPKNGRRIGPEQLRSVLGALVQSQEINFRRPKLEKSFSVVQASVVKYAPGFLPLFIDIMKETQTSMKNLGYFDHKEPIKSGEDRLMDMLTELKTLRLNVTKKGIKQEPECT